MFKLTFSSRPSYHSKQGVFAYRINLISILQILNDDKYNLESSLAFVCSLEENVRKPHYDAINPSVKSDNCCQNPKSSHCIAFCTKACWVDSEVESLVSGPRRDMYQLQIPLYLPAYSDSIGCPSIGIAHRGLPMQLAASNWSLNCFRRSCKLKLALASAGSQSGSSKRSILAAFVIARARWSIETNEREGYVSTGMQENVSKSILVLSRQSWIIRDRSWGGPNLSVV